MIIHDERGLDSWVAEQLGYGVDTIYRDDTQFCTKEDDPDRWHSCVAEIVSVHVGDPIILHRVDDEFNHTPIGEAPAHLVSWNVRGA